MNRLWVRLSIAFSATILIGAVILAAASVVLTSPGVRESFLAHQLRAEGGLVDVLADYYREHGSWQGVEVVLMGAETMLPGQFARNLGLSLVDAQGRIVVPLFRRPRLPGAAPRRQIQEIPIQVDGETVGFLRVAAIPPPKPPNGAPNFLERVRNILLLLAGIGGLLGLVLGVLMSRQLTAPLEKLAQGAHAVGSGQLSTRVPEEGTEEILAVARAFNEMAQGLEQAEELRRNLLADVAHELRTPLTVLQGNLQAILDDVYQLDKEEVARLYDQTRHLHRLVNDLHELAQAEARKLPLDRRELDLGQVAESAAASFEPMAEERQVRLTVQRPAQPVTVLGDAARLTQVVQNLVANALRHTPAGGAVTVQVREEAGEAVLEVVDTGEGIPPEHLGQIFDRFYRTDKARSRESGGAGLGLAIVRALVEAQGGRVQAESPGPGQGATFRVMLPGSDGRSTS